MAILKDIKDIVKEQAQEAVKASSDAVDFYVSTTENTTKANVKAAIADTVLAIADYITPYSSAMEVLDMLVKYGVFCTSNMLERKDIFNIVHNHNLELEFPNRL